ncbi:FkbM family methyltransferase [Flavobacteriaceae bacterium F89]|uniref:FkbM family methyltransferase n=1 Tax=Cerina litoralis TaxID=2874477 RepID=A0AAE3EXT5_9FLAO|nr:FkbM family methyltransferase [Cerina litoralis]MCG2462878.1 FkbM family methyltransferase [Cerina litoralis]
MKSLKTKIIHQIRLLQELGLAGYLSYSFRKNHMVKQNINGKKVWIRIGTMDPNAATSCFNGEFDILEGLFPKDYSGVIVDAGGYIGTAAIAFSEMYPNATVLTIEPSADNFYVLKKNVSKYPNIKPIHGALIASDDKKITLYNRNSGTWGFTVLKTPGDCPEAKEMEEIPAMRLSSLGVKMENIGILKLDIEGGEHALFSNDHKDLQLIPVIMIELHDRIIPGCSDLFFSFSKNRIVQKDEGEKYISIKKNFNQ